MFYYNGRDLSGRTYPDKGNNRKECIVFHHLCFNYGFKFQNFVCNGCHDLMMLYLNASGITIITAKCVNHCYIFHESSKYDAHQFCA